MNMVKASPKVFAIAALIYGGLLLKDLEIPTVLPVENVRVIGDLRFIDNSNIETIVSNEIHGGYFTVDLNKIRDALIQMPWVKDVSLRRQWPASLDVFITEQNPVAYWNDDGYINESGEVFSPGKVNRKLNLPILKGPEGHHGNVWKFMNELYQEMALLEYEVVRLDLDERRSWQLVVAEQVDPDDSAAAVNRIDVKLGRFETEKRLKRFIHILPSLASEQGVGDGVLADKNIKVIDMRYPNGFAVQLIDTQVSGA